MEGVTLEDFTIIGISDPDADSIASHGAAKPLKLN